MHALTVRLAYLRNGKKLLRYMCGYCKKEACVRLWQNDMLPNRCGPVRVVWPHHLKYNTKCQSGGLFTASEGPSYVRNAWGAGCPQALVMPGYARTPGRTNAFSSVGLTRDRAVPHVHACMQTLSEAS